MGTALTRHANLFAAATGSIRRHPGRSLVVILCLVGVLLPFVTGVAISEGVRYQTRLSVQGGADLYVARSQYGRNGPVDVALVEEIHKIPGVMQVVPRIVGRAYLGEELAVVVGIDQTPSMGLPASFSLQSGQVLMGRQLARRLGLQVGSQFHFSLFPALPFTIVALVDEPLAIWSHAMIVMGFNDAEQVFKLPGKASELLVYCRPGTAARIAEYLGHLDKPWDLTPPLRIQTRKIVQQYLDRGFDLQAGVFIMLYVTALGLTVPALLILSGLGRGERQREIGILKATGWQTLEVLEMTVFENLLLALAGSLVALLLALAWLRIANGIGIAPLFISGAGWVPDFQVPACFLPMPALFAFLFGLTLTLLGTIIPTWKAAVTPPLRLMQ